MNNDDTSPKVRRYNNSLREEQARQTRVRILESLTDMLMAVDASDLSVAAISKASGVSTATIYRHFPNREELIEGINEHIGRILGRPPLPSTVDELISGAPALFRYYEANFDRLRLAQHGPAHVDIREHGRARRDKEISDITADLVDHLEPQRARAVQGLIRGFFSFDTYELLRRRFGVDTERVIETVGWTVRGIIENLARERAASASDVPAVVAPKRPSTSGR